MIIKNLINQIIINNILSYYHFMVYHLKIIQNLNLIVQYQNIINLIIKYYLIKYHILKFILKIHILNSLKKLYLNLII